MLWSNLLNVKIRCAAPTSRADRIGTTSRGLPSPSHFLQVRIEEATLETTLDRTIDLIGTETEGAVRLERAYCRVPSLRCRSKEISQVFYTSITNAFQSMDGDGTLSAKTSMTSDEVVIEICDTGMGIAAEQVAKLFDIRLSAKECRVGMGLGFPMARYIIESHSSTLQVQSKVG